MIQFDSHSHQRFQHGNRVNALQQCNRTIVIEKNTKGCKGYQITPGDGYIVSIINCDNVHPLWGDNYQMSPKPMRVVEKNEKSISLRGYEVEAMTPFGFQTIDMSDYGITLFIENEIIVKCRLDMFDRNVFIEYYH